MVRGGDSSYFADAWPGVYVMTPHDRWLEPDEDDEPEDGLTTTERQQKAFYDFDPPDNEYGE